MVTAKMELVASRQCHSVIDLNVYYSAEVSKYAYEGNFAGAYVYLQMHFPPEVKYLKDKTHLDLLIPRLTNFLSYTSLALLFPEAKK